MVVHSSDAILLESTVFSWLGHKLNRKNGTAVHEKRHCSFECGLQKYYYCLCGYFLLARMFLHIKAFSQQFTGTEQYLFKIFLPYQEDSR